MTTNSDEGYCCSPFKSKKFIAFLVAEMTWKAVMILVLFWGKDSFTNQVWWIMMSLVLVTGFVEAGYIIGQASLDKYVKVAQIAAGNGKKLTMKGVSIGGDPSEEPSDLDEGPTSMDPHEGKVE